MKINQEKAKLPMYATRCRVFDTEKEGTYHAYGVPFVAHNDEEAKRLFRAQLGALRVTAERNRVAPFDYVIELCKVGDFTFLQKLEDQQPLFVPYVPILIDEDAELKGDESSNGSKSSEPEQLTIAGS